MASVTLQSRHKVTPRLADRSGAVMAVGAGTGGGRMVKAGRKPGQSGVADIALPGSLHMGCRFARGRDAIVTTGAGACDSVVINIGV